MANIEKIKKRFQPKQMREGTPRAVVERAINTLFLRKAKVIAHKLDRAGIKPDDPQRTFSVPPKYLTEAKRVGLTKLAGLRLV